MQNEKIGGKSENEEQENSVVHEGAILPDDGHVGKATEEIGAKLKKEAEIGKNEYDIFKILAAVKLDSGEKGFNERMEALTSFYFEDAHHEVDASHAVWHAVQGGIDDPFYVEKMDVDALLRETAKSPNAELLYSGEKKKKSGEGFKMEIASKWKKKEEHRFLKNKAFMKNEFVYKCAMASPRLLSPENFPSLNIDIKISKNGKISKTVSQKKLQEAWTKARICFLASVSKSLETRDVETWRNLENDGIPYHRLGYFFAQAANYVAEEIAIRNNSLNTSNPLSSVCSPAPSFALFSTKSKKSEVCHYISCVLSLIMPYKDDLYKKWWLLNETSRFPQSDDIDFTSSWKCLDCVNEEFILFDLAALAEKHGIYDKYEKVFEALIYRRKVQAAHNVHFNMGRNKWDKSGSKNLQEVLEDFAEENKRKPRVFSFGEGEDMIVEKVIMGLGLCDSLTGVDICFGKEDHSVEHVDGRVSHRFGMEGKIMEDEYGDHSEAVGTMGHILELVDGVDVIIASDSLHETADPEAYLMKLYDQLSPGGVIYVSEPYYLEILDFVTPKVINPRDSTKFINSMSSLENLYNMMSDLMDLGAVVGDARSIPGSIGGSNDVFQRLCFVVKKPE